MSLSIVVAVSNNNVIGLHNKLPWKLRSDLRRFSELTRNHTVIMGRNTFYSIVGINGAPLGDRRSLVLTDSPEGELSFGNSVKFCSSWKEIFAEVDETVESFIIGGALVYREAFKFADRVYLTRVNADVEGDTYLCEFDLKDWFLQSEEVHTADERNEYDYSFLEYARK